MFDAAVALVRGGDVARGEAACRQLLARQPDHAGANDLMAAIMLIRGSGAAGEPFAARAVALRGDVPDFHNTLGACLRASGRLEPALACFRRATELRPDFAPAIGNAGEALLALGRAGEAEPLLRRAIELSPRDALASFNLGRAVRELGRRDEAIDFFRRAAELNPAAAEALFAWGDALSDAGRLGEAVEPLRRAAALRPDWADAHNLLGVALVHQRKQSEGTAAFHAALQAKPDHVPAMVNFAKSAQEFHRHHVAIDHYERALRLWPDHREALVGLPQSFEALGRQSEAVELHRATLAALADDAAAWSNFLFALYQDPRTDADTIRREHQAWADRFARPLLARARPHDNPPDPNRRLRVGYVSGDLIEHPVAYFLEPLLVAHDRGAVEVLCYANMPETDAVTARLRGHADGWRDIHKLTDEAFAERVREDRVDVLVDLSVHTALNRLLSFAMRPAPVQLSYLGYCGTTGLADGIDGRITDALVDPPGVTEPFNLEPLVRLPRTFCCYRPPEDAPPVAPLPADGNGFVTFGSFNKLSKTTPAVLDAWAEILRAVPRSRLGIRSTALVEEETRREVAETFERRGVSADRLELLRGTGRAEYLRSLGQIDVALDTFPFAGHTTTCHAIWMGTPTVTLAQRIPVSRPGASLMTSVGLAELVTTTPAEYIAAAVRLAGDAARLRELRATMRDRLARSDLLDGAGMARAMETAFRQAWAAWCARTEG